MDVTDIRVFPIHGKHAEHLANVTFVLFAAIKVVDAKVYRDRLGRLRLGFPDALRTAPCRSCSRRTSISHEFCGWCGVRRPFEGQPPRRHHDGTTSAYCATVHPISAEVREAIETVVLAAYRADLTDRACYRIAHGREWDDRVAMASRE